MTCGVSATCQSKSVPARRRSKPARSPSNPLPVKSSANHCQSRASQSQCQSKAVRSQIKPLPVTANASRRQSELAKSQSMPVPIKSRSKSVPVKASQRHLKPVSTARKALSGCLVPHLDANSAGLHSQFFSHSPASICNYMLLLAWCSLPP